MAFTYVKFQTFIREVFRGNHDCESDVFKVVLCSAANAPSASGDAVLGDLTTVSLANLSGNNILSTADNLTGGTYKLTATDKLLAASGGDIGPFRYYVIYNDTHASDGLVCYFDRGAETTILDGNSLLLDFDDTEGLFQAA